MTPTLQKRKAPCIYEITTPDGHRYVGSSINVASRWREHLLDLAKNRHHSKKLQKAFDQFGKEVIQFGLLIYCKQEHLLFMEQSAIYLLAPELNTTNRADTPMRDPDCVARLRATLKTPESKIRKSKAARINWENPEYRDRYRESMKEVRGKSEYSEKASKSQKERRARPDQKAMYEKIHSDIEYRERQSKNTKSVMARSEIVEFRNSIEFKFKHSAAISAALSRPDVKKKSSEARKAMWANPDFREKRIADIRKYTSSEEYRLKMSTAVKAAKERKRNERANSCG